MIYFDQNKEAYNNKETLEKWGNTCIYSCDDDKYNDFLQGKYIWNENNELIFNPEWNNIVLNRLREKKISENDELRDKALVRGIIYKSILFDSDTEQKINLLAMVQQLENQESVIWYGKDNTPLECTKEDLINIGTLITELHTFCWTRNAEIKEAINNASCETEINEIVMDYGE